MAQGFAFWSDILVGNEEQCSRFPLIFNVSNNKFGSVESIGQRIVGVITWNFQLRRNLYEWEQDQLHKMLQVLAQVVFNDEQDTWRWLELSQGNYTVRSMYEKLIKEWGIQSGVAQPFPVKLVWQPQIAPNCKFFFWLVLLGRVLIKDRFINKGPRRRVFNLILFSDTVEELLIAWPASLGTEIGRRSWAMLPYAVIWVLWRIRNDAIFNSNMASVNKICVEIMAYIWFWMANWQGRKNFFFQDLVLRWHEVVLGLLVKGNMNITDENS
ncbi:hypothetical protein FRX31_033487 [Thalictrum thalictroides]|uniref:Reverse transcriptase zinc-binding domain-containing protein n=1 Tax=Thalictrum thalictroides TaxID=46969 RepID=A0A7J6UWE7_THATH|nr:hypothetical protein FRX31_033487 [Thalictrum thalictroides]